MRKNDMESAQRAFNNLAAAIGEVTDAFKAVAVNSHEIVGRLEVVENLAEQLLKLQSDSKTTAAVKPFERAEKR